MNNDDLVKSLILLAPQAIFNARLIMNLSPKLLDVAHKRLFTKPSIMNNEKIRKELT